MTSTKLSALIAEAVETDRQLNLYKDRLAELKAMLITEAESRAEEYTQTDGGGATWSADGDDGCIVRVAFPAPSLKSKIDGEGKAIDKIRAAAGKLFDRLFRQAPSYRPIENFRAEAEQLLGKDARKLIRLCETETAPRVSFETKEAAAG
jgi:hypothetical protein